MRDMEIQDHIDGIAIIGMAGRFPGAENIDAFWQNLRDGVESIDFFTEEELKQEQVDPDLLQNPNYVPAHGVLEDIDLFDAPLFGFNPREAEITDPQHRLFLECAWQALEQAGYDTERYGGRIGVYAGVGVSSYAMRNLFSNRGLLGSVGMLQTSINNRTDHLTTQVAYKLNLKGPGVTVQTACSTSLVAVHIACQSLWNGECDIALAGGVSIAVPQKAGYVFQEGGILSPDGHCRAFDAGAQGTVPGSGVGIVVLKRLEDAIAEGDTIHAVIRGSAINNDGSLKVGYTAPSVDGQAKAITEALAVAEVSPETVNYIEAHGTGTNLGDPIEIEALNRAFRASTDKKGFCAIGAVKSNVGHLDTAAGIAGLIKTVLALKHKQIPPSLHFQEPNPQIDFDNSPFYVNTKLSEWRAGAEPRRAGVSSFGLGGTNAHIVLEEAPAPKAPNKGRPWNLLLLSAKTSSALEAQTAQLADTLRDHPEVNLADVAYTLQVGRRAFNHRRAIICQDGHAQEALDVLNPNRVFTTVQEPKDRPVVFMFTGQGAQYVNMGLDLYQIEPVYREQVDRCCQLLISHLGLDLREVLYPEPDQADRAAGKLNQTSLTQPALFVTEYALARQLMEWGIQPEAMIGHSIGEYVAACLAGVFTLEEALALVAARGRLMQELPGGSMLVVPLGEKEVRTQLDGRLSLAAVNGTALCVVSGPVEAVDELERQLTQQGLGCRRLHTSHAFHSHMMDPILEPFVREIQKIELKPPQIPFLSNVTGTWITADQATDPGYWAKHIRQTVRFADGLEELVKVTDWLLLEVGPGRTLMTLARWHPHRAPGQIVLTSMPHADQAGQEPGDAFLLTTLGRLWVAGVEVDWSGYYAHEQRQRIPLPTYPFERRRYWIEAQPANRQGFSPRSLHKRQSLDDWFYAPSWKRFAPPVLDIAELTEHRSSWLIFLDGNGLGARIARRLEQSGQDVISVEIGEAFAETGAARYRIHPGRGEDYQSLIHALTTLGKTPEKILHCWGISHEANPEETLEQGFYSLLYLAQALGAVENDQPIQIGVVTNHMQDVVGGDLLYPEKSTVIGPCRAISQEYANITCRSMDLAFSLASHWQEEKLVDYLIAELSLGPDISETAVAYRGNYRWVQEYVPALQTGSAGPSVSLREGGVYLITGGLGGMGLELAGYLAKTARAKLVLTGRSVFPEREVWDTWLATHDNQDPFSIKIRKLQDMENHGAEVIVVRADAADRMQMQHAIDRATARFGSIHGVIHAAGIAGGGLIQLKTREMAASVLAPKVQGTRVIEEIFKDKKLDFIILCSSRNAILGGFGQVDYCAANAYLDAFAHYKNAHAGTCVVSINWAGWREVGMRVDTLAHLGVKADQQTPVVREPQVREPMVREIGHPLLAKCIEDTPERQVYGTRFSVATHWVLDDHRILRQPIIPGTTYLEMVRAALESHANGRPIELQDVYFLSALPVRDDEEKEVRAVIEKNGDGFNFRVLSQAPGGDGDGWQEYVIGKARFGTIEPPRKHDLAGLIERCRDKEILITDDHPIVTYEDLGPRWQSLKQVYVGHNELVALLELPEAFAEDVTTYKLHPALLDRANFTAKVFLAYEGLHLPFGYKGLRIKASLPKKVYIYARYKPTDDPLFETITFDVILMDEEGVELVVVDEFSQKRVREVAETIKVLSAKQANGSGNGRRQPAGPGDQTDSLSQELLEEGMAPEEGVNAFVRILSNLTLPQVVVSPQDLIASIQQAHTIRESRLQKGLEELETTQPKHERPEIQSSYAAPRNELEQTITEIWQDTLGIEPIGVHDNFFELGGDSVIGIQMVAKLRRSGFQVSPQQLFQNQTVAELAAALNTGKTIQAEQGLITGSLPLVPNQRRFLEQGFPEPHRFAQAMLLDVRKPVDPDQMESLIKKLLEHHDALRLRFEPRDSGWEQINSGSVETVPFVYVDLSDMAEAEQSAAIEDKARQLQASFDLAAGPLVQFALFNRGPAKNPQLLIAVHYLLIDNVSWWVLLSDLDAAYQQLEQGEEIQLPPKTSSFKDWAERIQEYAGSASLLDESDVWLAEPRQQKYPIPVDHPDGSNTAASADILSVYLGAEESHALLHTVPQVYHTVTNDVLLTALSQAISSWTGRDRVLVDLEDHGREAIFEELDLSRTIGSFRSIYPMLLDSGNANEPGEALKSIKEQLRRIPQGGIGYGLLRYLHPDEEIKTKLRALPQAEVIFSYLGQFDQALPNTSAFISRDRPGSLADSQNNPRGHLLEIHGMVLQDRLRVDWIYSENMHRRDTIKRIANHFITDLQRLIAHCQSPDAGGYTPSDFPLAGIDQESLDKIAAKFIKPQKVG